MPEDNAEDLEALIIDFGALRNRVRRLELGQNIVPNPKDSQDLREIGTVQTVLQFSASPTPSSNLPENTLFLYMDATTNHLMMVSPYTPNATLSANLAQGATSLTYTSAGDPFKVQEYIIVDTEQMLITAIDTATNTLTVTRAQRSTADVPHVSGARIVGIFDLSAGAGGVGGAPSNALYLVLAVNDNLSLERVFTPGTALSGADGGAGGAYTLNHAQVASGDLHQDYPLHASTETISGAWTFSTQLTMSGADIRLAAAGSIEDSGGTNRLTLTSGGEGLLSGTWRAASGFEVDGTLEVDGSADFDARVRKAQGADVASANDLTLGADGNTFEITGTTQINAITTTDWQNGSMITLLFTSNPTVKHNTAGGAGTAVMLLAGAADFASTAGDTLTLVLSEIGGSQAWREMARAVI